MHRDHEYDAIRSAHNPPSRDLLDACDRLGLLVLWSTGNEITERAGLSDGFELARKLADFVRGLDPTRPVTNAICSLFAGMGDEDAAKNAGAATLAAFGSANPITTKNYTIGRFTSYQGRRQAIVHAGYEAGSAELDLEVEGLGAVKVTIPVG